MSLASYYSFGSAGMTGALLGSLANSVSKKHDIKLVLIRAVENVLVVGFPVSYAVELVTGASGYLYYALVAAGVFFMWNNPMVRPFVDQVDAVRASLVNLVV